MRKSEATAERKAADSNAQVARRKRAMLPRNRSRRNASGHTNEEKRKHKLGKKKELGRRRALSARHVQQKTLTAGDRKGLGKAPANRLI